MPAHYRSQKARGIDLSSTSIMAERKEDSPLFLQRDASVGAVLDEQATIDEALVDAALLVSRVDHVVGACGLLEHADLVLALSRVVVVDGIGDTLKGLVTLRVVHLEGTGEGWWPLVSCRLFKAQWVFSLLIRPNGKWDGINGKLQKVRLTSG